MDSDKQSSEEEPQEKIDVDEAEILNSVI